jgi:Ca2+-binding RTX toxin-like protein
MTSIRSTAIPLLTALLLLAAAPAADAKVTSAVAGGILTISGDEGANQIAVTCGPDGNAKVNGGNPDSGAIACGKLVEVDAVTLGGNDLVDFSGVTEAFGEAKFPGFGTRTGAAAVTGLGNDRMIPSDTAFNLFFGEDGKDRAAGGDVRDQLSGGNGNDFLRGGDGRDSLLGNGDRDRIQGGPGGDTISGHAGNDLLFGEEGSDVIGGGTGIDRLVGGPGRDRLLGGAGKDILRGGPRKDIEIQDPPKAKKP